MPEGKKERREQGSVNCLPPTEKKRLDFACRHESITIKSGEYLAGRAFLAEERPVKNYSLSVYHLGKNLTRSQLRWPQSKESI